MLSNRSSRQKLLSTLSSAFFLLLSSPLTAQDTGSIKGHVRTTDGQPVHDAVVTVAGTRSRVAVDNQGRFLLESVTAGEVLLEVESVLHAQTIERVDVAPDETTEVVIVIASRVHSERIVVTASPHAHGELDLATPVSILEGAELALRLEPTLGQSLENEAGVTSTYFAPGASRPIIRGLGGDRVKMMENGIDVLDASSSSPDHAVAADPLAAERIEIVRGPATLLYGSNAIGGVVNVIDQRIPRFSPSEGVDGTVNLRTGSVADEFAAALDLGGGSERWAWNLGVVTRETGDYEIPGHAELEHDEEGEEHHDEEGEEHEEDEHEDEVFGLLPNSDIESTSGGAGVSYFFGDNGHLGVSVRGLESEYGVPGGHGHGEEDEHGHGEEDEEDEHGEEALRIDMRQRRYDLAGSITRPFGAFQKADFRLGIIDYEHDELEGPGVVGTTFFNDAWEARAEFVQKDRGSHHGSFGVQLRHRELEAIGEEAFLPPSETDNMGLFTFQEFAKGPVTYQAGLRYESQDVAVRALGLPDRDFDGVSASLGIVWQPSENYSLGGSLARSVKMPTGEELYSEGLHFATSAFELGDSNLGEETALGLDLTLRKVEGRFTGSVNLFRNEFSGYIFQRFTGDEEEGFPVLQWSQADADFWGAEVDATILLAQDAHSSWDLDLLWDLVRAEFESGENLPRIPPQRFGVGVHYRGDRLGVGAEARFVDDQDRLAENETLTDGHTLFNANFSYRFFFDSYFLDVIVRGTNLTDEDARLHTSFVKDTVPLPGRNVGLMVRLEL